MALQQTLRFIGVGVINTAIDFALLNVCVFALNIPLLPAHFIATAGAMLFSFIANRHFVFGAEGVSAWRQAIPFLLVTVTGMWGLQTLILATLTPLIETIWSGQPYAVYANVAKAIATIATMIWNYTLYKYVAFATAKVGNEKT